MKKPGKSFALGCLVAALSVDFAGASTIAVNFGAFGSATEPGYTDVFPTAAVAGTVVTAASDQLVFGTSTVGGVTITATSATVGGGAIADNRIRALNRFPTPPPNPEYTGPLSLLTTSWIGTQRGFLAADGVDSRASSLTISLSGVTAGLHTWTSYHLDNGLPATAGNGNQSGQLRIEFSNDSGVTFTTLASAFQIADTEALGVPPDANPFSHTFTSVAGQDVRFRFTNVAPGLLASGSVDVGQDFVVINGFNLIPEPSSALLGLIGALGLLRRRR
jgi:hypothetical protein